MDINDISELVGVKVARENSRKIIAYSITGAFIIFIFVSILFAVYSSEVDHFKNGKDLISTIGSVFGGLVGAVVGFYFGSDSNNA